MLGTTNGEPLSDSNAAHAEDAEKRLDRAAARGHISPAGEGWFKACCDPFEDVQTRVVGFPDGSNRQSIIQKLKKTITLTAPTASGTWDAFLNLWPVLISRAGYSVKAAADFGADDQHSLTNIFLGDAKISGVVPCDQTGGLTYVTCASGLNFWEQTSTTNTGHGALDCSELFNELLQSGASNPLMPIRCIAQGFEVQNNTPQLYIGGNCTSFRVPAPAVEEGWFFGKMENSEDPAIEFSGKFLPTLPNNSGDAFKIPGSTQWPAKSGVYMASRMQSEDNPPAVLTPMQLMTPLSRDPALDSDPFFTFQNQHQVGLGGTPPVADYGILPNVIIPFDHCGSYFTGLAHETVLTLNVIWYLESFPNVSDTRLLVMSQLSPPRDDVAIEIYSHTVDKLPNAVPFGMNPLGEWLRKVVDTMVDVMPKALPVAGAALSSIFPEFTPIIAPATAMATVAARKLRLKRSASTRNNTPALLQPGQGNILQPFKAVNVKNTKKKIKRQIQKLEAAKAAKAKQ